MATLNQKLHGILKELNPNEENYSKKVTLLAKIINEPTTGNICPKELVEWAKEIELEVSPNFDSGATWHTVRAKFN